MFEFEVSYKTQTIFILDIYIFLLSSQKHLLSFTQQNLQC